MLSHEKKNSHFLCSGYVYSFAGIFFSNFLDVHFEYLFASRCLFVVQVLVMEKLDNMASSLDNLMKYNAVS